MTVIEHLRQAIRDDMTLRGDAATQYAKRLSVTNTTLLRFLNGGPMKGEFVDTICKFLNLELRPIEAIKAKDKVKAPAMPAVDWTKTEPKNKPRDEGRERERRK